MVLDDLGELLQSAGLGTLAQTIFLSKAFPMDAPSAGTPDAILGLIETPGPSEIQVHDGPMMSIEQPIIQVRVRGEPYGYAAARLRAEQAKQVLASVHNQTVGSSAYLWIVPLQSPFPLDDDDYNRPHIIFHVRCAKALTALP